MTLMLQVGRRNAKAIKGDSLVDVTDDESHVVD